MIAVEILTRGLQCAPEDRSHVHQAQTEFNLEYGLIKEFMSVNQAGFNVLETRITRSHALTVTTVLLPSLLKHFCTRPEIEQLWSLPWAVLSTLVFGSAMLTLAS